MATLEQLIATCLMTPRTSPHERTCIWGLPLNIVGLSGCGKSERVAAVCKALKLALQIVFPASKQPEDFGGAPFPTPDGIVIECILPQANALLNIGQGVLFIDELSTARPAVQAAALGIVNDRRVGDMLLPPKVRVLTAMNPPEYAAGGFVLEAPLANRMMHKQYMPPPVKEWVEWLTGTNQSNIDTIQDAEQKVLQGWNDHWSAVEGLVIGFLTANPTRLHQQPEPGDPASGGPWPSHRMWNWAARAVATSRCLDMPKELENDLVMGCVGEGPMLEWAEWVAKADLPNPKDMLTKGWIPDTERLDISIAALTSATTWIRGLDKNGVQTKYAKAAWEIIKSCKDLGIADIALPSANILVTADLAHLSKDDQLREVSKEVILDLGRSGYTRFAGVGR